MDSSTNGSVLLVGDGDFSLSLAFVERGYLRSSQITSTSLESEETISKHQCAVGNIQLLRSKGVKVYFEVDARELHSDSILEDRKFSRIIFNFPHSGGKSNHKKNRALLNDFFCSATQVLEDDGQIMLTLCKGQGGTPADKPRRAWHDSWQIMSMATNSSLILRYVIPFNADDYTGYNSTGFRSQDKGFNTEGAITHVFELSDSVNIPSCLHSSSIKIEDRLYSCSPYLQHRLNRNLLQDANQPISQVERRLRDEICENMGISLSTLILPWYTAFTPQQTDSKHHYILKQIQTRHEEKEIDTLALPEMEVKNLDSDKMSVEDFDMNINNANDDFVTHLGIRTTLLEQFEDISDNIHMKDKCIVTSGIVAKSCSINLHNLPVQHESIIVCPRSILPTMNIDMFSQSVCRSISNLSVEVDCWQIKETADFDNMENTLNISEKRVIIFCENRRSVTVASVLIIRDCFVVLLSLDKLTQIVFNIEICRLLWSKDNRFSEQFMDIKQWPVKFEPFYIYPMMLPHDLSFWEKEGEEFCEIDLCNIVRDVTGDVVESVELLDRYQDSTSQRWSRCYRFMYISHDQSLSYITSWKLQSLLRLELAQRMQITLR